MADDLKPWEKAAKQATSSTELKPWEKASQKKSPVQNDGGSISNSSMSGGITDLNSLASGSKVSTPTPLTAKGVTPYKQGVAKQQKDIDTALGAFEQAQGVGSVERIQEVIRNQPVGQIRDSSQDPSAMAKSVKNSFSNLATSLKGVVPRLDLVSTSALEKTIGKDNAKSFTDFLNYNPFTGDQYGRDFTTIQNEALDRLDELSTQTLPTQGVLENVRNFNVPGLAAATVDAFTSLAATAIPSVASGGTLLASEMIGGSLYDYNDAKAKAKGVDIKDLYEKGEADFAVPAFLGSVAFGLEKIGLKGIEKGIKGKLVGNGYKKAMLLANDANKEGLTEWVQVGIDTANNTIGQGGSAEDATRNALDAMFSAQGMEAYAKGALGSGVAIGGGRLAQKLVNPKSKTQLVKLEETKQAALQDLANDNVPIGAKEAIVEALVDTEAKIDDLVNKDFKATENLSEEQRVQAQEVNQKIADLDTAIPTVSEATKPVLEEQKKVLETELKDIIDNPKGEQDAITERNIEQDNQQQREGIVEQQQGQQEDRVNQEEPISQTETSPSSSDSITESREVQEEVIPDNSERISDIETTLDRNAVELENPELDPEMREFIGIQNEQLQEELNTLQASPQTEQSIEEITTPDVEQIVSEELIDTPIEETNPVNIPQERIAEIQVKRQSIKDSIKEKLKAQRGQLSSGFDPSLIKDFVELGATYAEEGVVREEDFIKRFREDYKDVFGDDKDITDEQIKTEVFDKVVEPVLSNNTIENEALNNELSQTTLRNADVEQKRKDYGFDAPLPRKGQTDEQLRTQARKAIESGYDVYELMDKAFAREPISGVESVILAQFQATKEAQLIEINRKIEDAKNQSVTSFEKAVADRDKILDDLLKAYDASELSGTVASDALRARKVKVLQDYSLANMLIKYRKANNNDNLTPEQIKEVTDRYQALTEAEAKLNARIEQLEKENAVLRAKEEVVRIRKQQEVEDRRAKRTRTKETLKSEREDIFEQMRKLANKQRGTLSANPIPVEMLPLIAKLVKNYVADGVVNVEDIIDDIHLKITDIIEDVTVRDVRDAISGYGYETTKTKSEIQRDIENLKKQAKLISKIEDAEKGILKTKENTPRRTELDDRLKSLRYQLAEFTRDDKNLSSLKTRVQNQIKDLESRIKKGNFDKDSKTQVKLDEEALKLRDAYRRIKFEFDVEVEKQKLAQRTKFQKYKDLVVEIANIPRALMATADLSAPLRQGILPTISNPKLASKAFVEMMKQWSNQERADRWLNDLKDSPAYQLMEESGLYIADKSNPNVAAREEDYMTNLAEKIPIIGGDTVIGGKKVPGLVQASERAYVGYLNKMRVDLFTRGVDALETSGVTFENNPKAYKALAKYVNAATGRGDLGEALNRAAPILNAAFFSPRLMASRLQLLSNWLNPKFYKETPLAVKKMYFGDMAKLLAFGVSILALASLAGADVEEDPRSPDFGKIRNGDTRWDIWGGFQQYVRIMAQLAWGEKKSTASGRITPLDGTSYNKETRLTQAWSFIRGKFAPVPAFLYNAIEGQNTIGEPFRFNEELKNMLKPLVAQGIYDSAQQDGWAFGLLATGLPSVFGVGVQTYGVNSFLDKGIDNKLVDLLIDKKAVAIEPKDGERKVFDINTGEEREMTSAEFKKYYDKWVEYIKDDLKSNYNDYKGMSNDKFEKRFRSIKIEATKAAKKEIVGFGNEDLTITYNDEEYELSKDQIKDRVKYMNEYKSDNGETILDSYIEKEKSDGKSIGEATRLAKKKLESKAREYSKKMIISEVGIENLKKKED